MALNMARNKSARENRIYRYLIKPGNGKFGLKRLRFRKIMAVSALHSQDNERLPSKSSSWAAASQRTYTFQGLLRDPTPCSQYSQPMAGRSEGEERATTKQEKEGIGWILPS
ncbi:hypothetical protein BO83DRAFT_384227 [Aspergillus eucalypticola CBS 122712]|uniref:Uncharacterized protein n=1 Tax=Aspergillus eucalypticola (strain CBS 122712 / IBT 29274) TaxID=1448314 RepID=A0A317WK97_ASPEC|nr:uncharacterized protein BO83DRAFT_384227 [Aspergillus eucalypticola CBS 122712]PWY85498.1 hypothetical protein BO83DRAFT_384227 [Aspergillus eucalypticola CBS 122712]